MSASVARAPDPREGAAESRRGPHFIGIGAQKAATTFVYENLRLHPHVDFPATPERGFDPAPVRVGSREVRTWPKEIRFLQGENSSLSWDEYLSIFDGRTPGALAGEITPSYLFAPRERIEELREHVPDVRLFVVLRDPVERDWSSIRMEAGRHDQLDDLGALRRIAASRAIRRRGEYVAGLEAWLDVFPREQLLILPYELLKQDYVAFLSEIFDHLGTSFDLISKRRERPIFVGPEAPLPAELRGELIDRHRGIVGRLHEQCGVDFSRWWSPELREEG